MYASLSVQYVKKKYSSREPALLAARASRSKRREAIGHFEWRLAGQVLDVKTDVDLVGDRAGRDRARVRQTEAQAGRADRLLDFGTLALAARKAPLGRLDRRVTREGPGARVRARSRTCVDWSRTEIDPLARARSAGAARGRAPSPRASTRSFREVDVHLDSPLHHRFPPGSIVLDPGAANGGS